MTEDEAYKVYIQYTFNAFCKVVIRHAAIDEILKLKCCGMPLNEDGLISREPDGSYNEDYCKWCYANGKFAYQSKESLLDYLVANMPNPDNADEETRRNQFDLYLSQLKHWK